MNEKKLITSLLLWVLPLWITISTAFLFLTLAKAEILLDNDSTFLIALFLYAILEIYLTISPFYLTIVSWIIGYKTTRKIVLCIIINIILLVINFVFYLWYYGIFGTIIFWH